MYAVVEISGKQYKVQEGDIVFVDRIEAEEGKTMTFESVLLVSDGEKVTIGNSLVKDAKVEATVIGQGKSKKIIVYKYKAKKNERKTRGHRQPYTKIQIEKISLGKAKKAKTEEVETQEQA
ncbi:MAG: 50S ribosomal protein L21 [Clostridia bacterium]|nr:50S ribosomal protein L21 [Clostridia bacterium]